MCAKFSDFWTPSSPLSLSHSRNLSILSSRFDQPVPSPQCRRHLSIAPYRSKPSWFRQDPWFPFPLKCHLQISRQILGTNTSPHIQFGRRAWQSVPHHIRVLLLQLLLQGLAEEMYPFSGQKKGFSVMRTSTTVLTGLTRVIAQEMCKRRPIQW